MPILGGNQVVVSIFPTSLDFGVCPVGVHVTLNFRIFVNAGINATDPQPVHFAGVTFNNAHYTSTAVAQWIAVDSFITIPVTFLATAAGTVTANALVGTSEVSLSCALTATGVVTGPAIAFTVESPNFGSQLVSTTSAISDAVIKNSSPSSALTVTAITIRSPFAASTTLTLPITVPPNSEHHFGIVFSPVASGTFSYSDGVTVVSDAGTVLFALNGVGVAAIISVSPTNALVDRWTALGVHGTLVITATVSSGDVVWTGVGIVASGLTCTFTAPDGFTDGRTFIGPYLIRATSSLDDTVFAECSIIIQDLLITVSPIAAFLGLAESISITATCLGDVTWTCDGEDIGVGAGARLFGSGNTITFTSTNDDSGVHVVTATSVIDTTRFAESRITIGAPGTVIVKSVHLFPTLRGLTWDVKMTPEFFGSEQTAAAPGYQTEISYGPDPIYHIECSYSILRDTAIDERHVMQNFFESRRGRFHSFLLWLPNLTKNTKDGLVTNQTLTTDINGLTPIVVNRPYENENIYELQGVNGNPGLAPIIRIDGVVQSPTDYQMLGPGVAFLGGTYPGLVLQFLSPINGVVTADFFWMYRVRFEQDKLEFNEFSFLFWEAKQIQLVTTRT